MFIPTHCIVFSDLLVVGKYKGVHVTLWLKFDCMQTSLILCVKL